MAKKKNKLNQVPDLGGEFLGVEEDKTSGGSRGGVSIELQGELFPVTDPGEKADFLYTICLGDIFQLLEGFFKLREESLFIKDKLKTRTLRERYNPKIFEEVLSILSELRGLTLSSKNSPLFEDDTLRLKHMEYIHKVTLSLIEVHNEIDKERVSDYQIRKDPISGEDVVLEFPTHSKGDSLNQLRSLIEDYKIKGGDSKLQKLRETALKELKTLNQLPPRGQIIIPTDQVSSYHSTAGDVKLVGTDEDRKIIEKLQSKGKLLFAGNTLEGLSGGNAFFKSFCIALAKILNEQSKYYHPDKKEKDQGEHLLLGVPKERIKEVFGKTAKIEEDDIPVLKGEERDYPYILLSYERLAKELKKDGKISGGKDVDFIRDYINGGYTEFQTDPKTGKKKPVKSSYRPGIASKKYPVSDGYGNFLFIPFVVNEAEIVDSSRRDPEVGCLLRLSPQFAKTLKGFTSLRGDTIRLIGGAGNQKDITMDMIAYLAERRKLSKELRRRKSEILAEYEDRPTYRDKKTGKRRTWKLEAHFQEAIQKAISAKLITEYREDVNPGGEIISVFVFNPDYLKGVETSQDEQRGE